MLKSPTISVLPSIFPFTSICVCLSIEVLLCWVHKYLQLLCLLVGLISWSFCIVLLYLLNILYFRVYFVWFENCYFNFLLISICMDYLFLSSHFQSVCISRSELDLLCVCVYMTLFCEWTLFCVHSANLCLLVEEFNQFSFKVIFDTGTFSLFWVCFCRSFPSLLFPAYRSHFNIYFKASLVMLNFLTFASL